MPKFMTSTDYKSMPWRNGQGSTTELIRIPSSSNQDFVFRLSMAQVKNDGPFSIFPHIDRTLLILEGEGLKLHFQDRNTLLSQKLASCHFAGEEEITAQLLQGPILDFNIMTDRRWGKSHVAIHRGHAVIEAIEECVFIFDPDNKSLVQLEKGERLELNSNHDLVTVRVHRI